MTAIFECRLQFQRRQQFLCGTCKFDVTPGIWSDDCDCCGKCSCARADESRSLLMASMPCRGVAVMVDGAACASATVMSATAMMMSAPATIHVWRDCKGRTRVHAWLPNLQRRACVPMRGNTAYDGCGCMMVVTATCATARGCHVWETDVSTDQSVSARADVPVPVTRNLGHADGPACTSATVKSANA